MENLNNAQLDLSIANLILQDLYTSFNLDEKVYRAAIDRISRLENSQKSNTLTDSMPATA